MTWHDGPQAEHSASGRASERACMLSTQQPEAQPKECLWAQDGHDNAVVGKASKGVGKVCTRLPAWLPGCLAAWHLSRLRIHLHHPRAGAKALANAGACSPAGHASGHERCEREQRGDPRHLDRAPRCRGVHSRGRAVGAGGGRSLRGDRVVCRHLQSLRHAVHVYCDRTVAGSDSQCKAHGAGSCGRCCPRHAPLASKRRGLIAAPRDGALDAGEIQVAWRACAAGGWRGE
mmetsp:Transcript_96243/g.255692  ORF Transcript_96243/g.255692 Transcript_96243/m.255692 type:complete len:232 (-) Transcript_96243:328-1023(-)